MFAVSTESQRVTDGEMTDGQTDIFRQHSRSVKMGQICLWPGHRPGLQSASGRRFPTPSRLGRVNPASSKPDLGFEAPGGQLFMTLALRAAMTFFWQLHTLEKQDIIKL